MSNGEWPCLQLSLKKIDRGFVNIGCVVKEKSALEVPSPKNNWLKFTACRLDMFRDVSYRAGQTGHKGQKRGASLNRKHVLPGQGVGKSVT